MQLNWPTSFRSPVTLLLWMAVTSCAWGQPTGSSDGAVPEGTVQLNFPEQSELKSLVDYVSQRLGVKILYDESIANKKITVRAPQPVPTDSLLELLSSTLKMKGLAMVDADVAGWKRIVATEDLAKIATMEQSRPLDEAGATEAITQAFTLAHVAPQKLAELIKPFLTTPGANTITLDEQRVLIVTDYANNLRKIAQLIETIDKAGPEMTLEFYAVQHVEAPTLQRQISEVLTARIGASAAAATAVTKLQITPDERTNQLMLVGTPSQVREARQLAEALDVPLGLATEVYSFQYVEASRIDRLICDLFDPLTIKRLYRGAVDQEDNLLIVSGTSMIHDKIRWLKSSMDVESKRPGSAVQFYRLRYANAAEVLQTIQSIQRSGNQLATSSTRGVSSLGRGRWNDNQYAQAAGDQQRAVPGPNAPAVPGAAEPPVPPAQQTPVEPKPATAVDVKQEESASGLLAGAAQVTADPISNTIIVVADRAVQQVYADLITYLDRRRPQVMIEARVVIIDTSDDFSLGIELSAREGLGLKNVIQFTSFGLATANPTTGSLALIPGRGANIALVEPEAADAVLRALSSHRRSKIISSPRVLVNDNATGTLASVAEVPFTSVNASNTVATTSFAGFAEAGTSIEVTPRITDDDHLQLDYVVTLNSFTGTGGAGVPPPRQTDEIASSVTIPDGYTVIVGGLNRETAATLDEGIPLLEKIPIVKHLTSHDTKSSSKSTLFVFLRPVILREDKFEDLKYLSDRDIARACDVPNFPRSMPVLIR